MKDPGFRVDGIHQGTPFRSRGAFDSYLCFAGDAGAVLVEPAIARQLRLAASDACPHETGGLLSGRALRDGGGPYVVISGFVEAQPDAGGPAAFSISPRATALLREEACAAHPAADVVGWWHSHLRPSFYSETDKATQGIWTQPESVGLLVFAAGQPWGTAYLGPDAQRLAQAGPFRPGEPAAAGTGPQQLPPGRRPGQPASPGPPEQARHAARQRRRFVLLAILTAGVLLVAAATASLHHISGQLSSVQHQLGRQPGRVPARPDPPAVIWSCVPEGKSSATCEATLHGLTGTVEWQLDGGPLRRGLRATFHLRGKDRTHKVSLLVTSRAGTLDGGSQVVG